MRSFCLILIVIAIFSGLSQAASVTVGGWTFTANPGDEWRAELDNTTEAFDNAHDCHSENVMWSGVLSNKPFFIPKGPTELHYSGIGGKSGYMNIEVLEIPKEFKGLDTGDLLKGATDRLHCPTVGEGSDKDIDFGGKEAHLWEKDETLDGNNYSDGVIAVKMSDDEIAVIDVERWDDTGKRAWDVIEAFTISK